MGKLVVLENDRVEGTDTHNVTGVESAGSPPPVYKGTGQYEYVGKMIDHLSDFVTINSKPVVLKTSKSSLNPGEATSPTGRHSGPMGKNFDPPAPAPNPTSLKIDDQIGEGKPSANAGSSFVTADGIAILLDGDKIDTCDGIGNLMNSTVTAENQDFVFCSE